MEDGSWTGPTATTGFACEQPGTRAANEKERERKSGSAPTHGSRLPAATDWRGIYHGESQRRWVEWLASPAGFEPATRCLEGSRSVH